jgi:hypothetical protein
MCDYAGAGNTGTYASSAVDYGVSGPLTSDTTQTGVAGSGLTAPLGTLTDISGLDGQSFTLEGWFKGSSSSPNEVLVALSGDSNEGMAIWKDHSDCDSGSDVYLALDEDGADNCWDAQSIAGINLHDGNWHYMAITYDVATNQVTGYVDGQDLGAETYDGSSIFWSEPDLLVGGWIDTNVNQRFADDVAQVAVYDTALSSGQINAHYQASSAAPGITVRPDATDDDAGPTEVVSHDGLYSYTVGGAIGSSPPTADRRPAADDAPVGHVFHRDGNRERSGIPDRRPAHDPLPRR